MTVPHQKTALQLCQELADADIAHKQASNDLLLGAFRIEGEVARDILAEYGRDLPDEMFKALSNERTANRPEYQTLVSREEQACYIRIALQAELRARELAAQETVAAGWQATLDREARYAALRAEPSAPLAFNRPAATE